MTSQLPLGLRPADVVGAVVTGVLTLPDPARRSRAGRFALRSAAAGLTGAMVWVGLGEDPELGATVRRRGGITAGAVALVYGTAPLGERLDAVTQRALLRCGVRRPRVLLAVAGTGLGLAMAVKDRRAERAAAADAVAPVDDDAAPAR